MKYYISVICALSVLAAFIHAAPFGLQSLNQQIIRILANVKIKKVSESRIVAVRHDAANGSAGVAAFNTTALVTTLNQKIQLLRQFCPQLFQVIDNVVQNVTSQVFSVVGRVILRNGLGGSIGGGGGGGESRVSVVLPTFPPDDEDYDDEDETDNANSPSTTNSGSDAVDIRIINPRTSTTQATNEIALSANEVDAEEAPFTAGQKLKGRVGENRENQEMLSLFDYDDDDCWVSAEPVVAKTSSETVDNVEIANRNLLAATTTNAISISTTTTDNENVDATTSSSDNVSSALEEVRSDNINAIFKSLVQVENSADFQVEITTAMNPGAELSTEGNADSSLTETITNGFNIKLVHNGSVINTIPLIDVNKKESDNVIKKRSPANEVSRSRRVIREAESDQDAAASGGNGPDPADLSDIEAEDSERDKRYLPFGGEAHVSAGGGSGNFLFDIIRRTADGAARAAGTVYRMVAGTENLGIGLSATSTTTRFADASAISQLIAGSGATEESDEKDNGAGAGGVAEIDVAKSADGYTEGIPGPITRLFVIANRGLANLVQDLILRLAATSERIVNFKARLITALI